VLHGRDRDGDRLDVGTQLAVIAERRDPVPRGDLGCTCGVAVDHGGETRLGERGQQPGMVLPEATDPDDGHPQRWT
jgi:hypothetical protein